MTPQEAYELAKQNTNFKAQQEKNKVIGEGTSYNPLERTAFENIVQQNAMNKGLVSANQQAPVNQNNINMGQMITTKDPVTGKEIQVYQEPLYGSSTLGTNMARPEGGLTYGDLRGKNVAGYDINVPFSQQGTGFQPGQTTSFTKENTPAPIPAADKTEIPLGDVKQKQEQVIVQDKKGNQTQLNDTDKIVVKRKPDVNLFDFLEAAAAGAGRNPNKNTALNQRMAEYYNQLDEQQKMAIQNQYAEKMAAIQNQYELEKLNRQYQWELALRKQQLNPYGIPPQAQAGIMAQAVAGGK